MRGGIIKTLTEQPLLRKPLFLMAHMHVCEPPLQGQIPADKLLTPPRLRQTHDIPCVIDWRGYSPKLSH